MSRNSSEYQGAWAGGVGSAGGPHSGPLYSDGSQGPGYASLGSSANAFCAAGDGLMVQRGASWTAGQTSYQSPLSGLQQMQLGLGPRPELGLQGDGSNFAAAQQQQQQQWLAMAGVQVSSLGSSPPSHSLQQQLANPAAFGGAGAAPAAGRPISSKNPFAAMPRALRNNQLRNNLLAAAGSFTDMAGGGGSSSRASGGGLAPPPPPIRHSSLPVDPAATAAAVAAAHRMLSAEQEQQQHAGAMAQPPPPPPPPPPQQQQGAAQQRHAAAGALLTGIEEEPAAPEANDASAAGGQGEPQPVDHTATPPAASPEASGGSWSSGTRPGSGYSSLAAAAGGRDAPASVDGAWRPSRRSLTGAEQHDPSLQYLQQQQAAAAAAQRLAGLGLGSRRREAPAGHSGRDFDGLCGVERSVFSDPLLYGAQPSADSQQQPTDVARLSDQRLGHHHAGLPAVPVPRSVSDPTVLMVAHSGLSFTSARAKPGASKGSYFGQPAAPAAPAPSGGGVMPAEMAEHVQLLLQRQQALQAMQQEVQEQLLQLLPHSGGADQQH